MLRTLKSPFLGSRILPFNFSKSGSAFTSNIPGALQTFASSGAGLGIVYPKDQFNIQTPIIVGSCVSTAATTPRYFTGRTPTTNGRASYGSLNEGGTAGDFPVMGFVIGQDHRDSSVRGSQVSSVTTTHSGLTLSSMFVDVGGATYNNLQGAVVTSNGTGDTSITFPLSGAQDLIAVVTPVGSTALRAWVHSTTKNSIRVLQRNAADDAAANVPFYLIFARIDAKSISRGRKAAKVNQPQAILLSGQIVYTAGVPGWAVGAPGSGLGTIVDQGTGDLIINLRPEFQGLRRGATVAIAGNDLARTCTVDSTTETSIRIRSFNPTTDAAADPNTVNFMALVYRNTGNFRG